MNSVLVLTRAQTKKTMAEADFSSLKASLNEFRALTPFGCSPDEDANDFLYRFETIVGCFDVSDEMRVTVFPLCLTGQALLWFKAIEKDRRKIFTDILELFRNKCIKQDTNLALVQDLLCRRKCTDESVFSFSGYLRSKGHLLKGSNQDLMEKFIFGLRDHLMEYVVDKCPTDFNHAVSLATTAESFEKFRANRPKVGAIQPSANETSLLVEMVRGISEGLGLKIEHHVQTNESIHDTLTGT